MNSYIHWQTTTLPAILCSVSALAETPSFIGLGLLPDGTYTFASDVSDDGAAVVGWGNTDFFGVQYSAAWKWTPADGIQNLGWIPSEGIHSSVPQAISADAGAIVGQASNPSHAFRWTLALGMQSLATSADGDFAISWSVSADGSVVVGSIDDINNRRSAFRWTQATGVQSLPELGGPGWTEATDVSADGSIIVGYSSFTTPTGGASHAVRWVNGGAPQDLGVLPSGTFSIAQAVSADGTIIVGYSGTSSTGWHAFRWTQTGGLQDMGTLPGHGISNASAISADGSVILGTSGILNGPNTPFLWTAGAGMFDVADHFAAQGLDLTGWAIQTATGLSANGQTIVGTGAHNGQSEAWRATIALPVAAPAVSTVGVMLTILTVVALGASIGQRRLTRQDSGCKPPNQTRH